MKVLLLEPPVSPFDVPTKVFAMPPPYHLEVLAGRLVGNHDVHILDMRIDEDLDTELSIFKPDVVGCSCVAANSHLAKQVLQRVKQLAPDIVTVVGGHHPSLMPEDCNEAFIDAVVIGEGEETLYEFVGACESKRNWGEIPGIAYRSKEREFRINQGRELMDLDKLPMPARALTGIYRDKRLYFRGNWRPIDCTITSRGCPHKCTFCGLWKINRGMYRPRAPRSIADELEVITVPYICFIDDNTLDHMENASILADEIKRRGIKKKYELYGRVDTIVRRPDLIEKWCDAGMELLLIGLEACDDQALQRMRKRTTTKMNRKAIEICHANGVEVVAYLIVDPAFDHEDFRRLSEYVEENNLTHPVFTILSPFPGTDLYNMVKDTLITEGFELMDFFHTVLPTRLPLDEFYEEFLGLYRRAYPFKNFIISLAQGKPVLSPRTIFMNLKMRKRMASLRGHHDLVGRAKSTGR
jgi:hopanoid C-3 methylase